MARAIVRYLTASADMLAGPSYDDIRAWHGALEPVRIRFHTATSEPEDQFSSAEVPLLALPEIDREWTVPEITSFVDGYVAAMTAAREEADLPFVIGLAEYGRRYEVLVETTVPLGAMFAVSLSEDRPLGLGKGGRTYQTVALGDAKSVHIEARVDDVAVRFGTRPKPLLAYPDGRLRSPAGTFDGWEATAETISLYSTAVDEDGPIRLVIKLRSRALLLWTTIALSVLDVSAAVAVFRVPRDDLYVERLALLLVPATFAATLVLTREQSALAARIQLRARLILLGSLIVLWVVTLGQLVVFRAPATTTARPTASGSAAPDGRASTGSSIRP